MSLNVCALLSLPGSATRRPRIGSMAPVPVDDPEVTAMRDLVSYLETLPVWYGSVCSLVCVWRGVLDLAPCTVSCSILI